MTKRFLRDFGPFMAVLVQKELTYLDNDFMFYSLLTKVMFAYTQRQKFVWVYLTPFLLSDGFPRQNWWIEYIAENDITEY